MNYSQLQKTSLLIFILLMCVFASQSKEIQHYENKRLYLDYSILESELAEGNYITGDLLENGFDEYSHKKFHASGMLITECSLSDRIFLLIVCFLIMIYILWYYQLITLAIFI